MEDYPKRYMAKQEYCKYCLLYKKKRAIASRGMCGGHYKRWLEKPGILEEELAKPLREAKKYPPLGSAPKPKEISAQALHDREIAGYKGQLSLLDRKYKELLKQVSAQDRIVEFNKLAVQAMPTVKIPPQIQFSKIKTPESLSLLLGDFHIGETIKKEHMAGLNFYNFDEFVRRFQYVIEKVIHFTISNMSAHQFDALYIQFLGDIVSGTILEDIETTNQLNIVEQAHLGALVVAQGLIELCRSFPKVICTCVSGNHGRVKQKKYYKAKQQVNWDYVFYETLTLLLQNQKNIEFRIPLSPWAGVEIRGWRLLAMHGDDIKSWAGIPFYGINRAADRMLAIEAVQKRYFQYFVIAHFHQKGILQWAPGEKIINGSMIGTSEHGVSIDYAKPLQLLFRIHQKYGKTWELSINPSFATGPIRYKYNQSKDLSSQLDFVR